MTNKSIEYRRSILGLYILTRSVVTTKYPLGRKKINLALFLNKILVSGFIHDFFVSGSDFYFYMFQIRNQASGKKFRIRPDHDPQHCFMLHSVTVHNLR